MKITAVTDNYRIPAPAGRPGWLYIPDSAMIRSRKPFFVPDFDSEFRAYLSAAIRIDRVGKGVAAKFARRYRTEITAAVSVRAESLARELSSQGLPWGEALVFDRSLLLGDFIDEPEFERRGASLRLTVDGEPVLEWNSTECRLGFDEVIAEASRDNTIKTGDIILPALTDTGVPLFHPSILRVECGGEVLLETRIR